MTQPMQTVGARLRAIGRCALVGTLAGMLAAQAVAEGAAGVSKQTTTRPETRSVTSESQTKQISLALPANLPLAPQGVANADLSALPEAPTASTGMSDSASVIMPPELKAMMDEASQNAQNVQPAPAKKSHGVQRPGMLTMGIIGLPFTALGAYLYVRAPKNKGYATILFAPGVAMSGFGFYFAFKPKQ